MDSYEEIIKEAVDYLLGAELLEENGYTKEMIEKLNKLKNEEFEVIFKYK